METLPPEVLQRIFSFFLSDKLVHEEKGEQVDVYTPSAYIRRQVDGTSIRAASLVCKQFHHAVNSKALWQVKTLREYRRLAPSFMISELDENNLLQQSFVGFRKLKFLAFPYEYSELIYAVQERSTGDKWVLIISAKGREFSPRYLKEWYGFLVREFLILPARQNDRIGNAFRNRSVWGYRYDFDVTPYTTQDLEDFVHSIYNRPPAAFSQLYERDHQNQFSLSKMLSIEIWITEYFPGRRSRTASWPSDDVWAQLMDWLIEVGEVLGQDDRVAYQAAAFLDGAMAASEDRIRPTRLQLFAGSALLLASKLDKKPLTEIDICHSADNSFTVKDVKNVESAVLNFLGFNLVKPTCMDYLARYARILRCDKYSTKSNFCAYITELALRIKAYHEYPATVFAGACIVLTNFALKEHELWPKELEESAELTLARIAPCAVALSNYFERERTMNRLLSENMTKLRYAKEERKHVSEMALPFVASEQVLLNYGTKKRKR